MKLTEFRDLLGTSSIAFALVVFFSSLALLIIGGVGLPTRFAGYYEAAMDKYGLYIPIALVVSAALIIGHLIRWGAERIKQRGTKLRIVKATWGTESSYRGVTWRLRRLVSKDRLDTMADDDVLLRKKEEDPAPGQRKTLTVEYWYKHTAKFEQCQPVEIGDGIA